MVFNGYKTKNCDYLTRCAINMEEHFCDVFGEELLHAKILVADLKLGF